MLVDSTYGHEDYELALRLLKCGGRICSVDFAEL